jgi:MarR family
MSGPYRIKGADGKSIDIPAGQYYINPKSHPRRLMLNSLSPEARRVYACIELASMGFHQELAVVQVPGPGNKTRPMTPGDIRNSTGLSKQNVRRSVAELEDQGLAERRGSGGGRLLKGAVEIYCWATPHEPKKKHDNKQTSAKLPSWYPPEWKPLEQLIIRRKYKLPEDLGPERDSVIANGAVVARDYQNTEMVVERFLNGVCARPKSAALNKVERTERYIETPTATTTGETAAPSAVVVVGAELRIHGPVVEPAVVKFVEACRKNCPDCTAEEIVQEIRTTARSFDRSIRSPFGVLKTSVPGTIAASIEKRRARLRSEAAAKLAEDQHTATIILENPDSYAAEDIAWARAVPMSEKAKGAGNA